MAKLTPQDQSLKFPNGCSVKRAKLRAKTLAKESSIPLHQALDDIARANGLALPWEKALDQLRAAQSLHRRSAGFTFRLPGRPGVPVVGGFSSEQRVAYIVGGGGSGRRIAALAVAAAANIVGLRVHSFEISRPKEWLPERDMQSTAELTEQMVYELMAGELQRRYPSIYARTRVPLQDGRVEARIISEVLKREKPDMILMDDGALFRADHSVNLLELPDLVEAFPPYLVLAFDPADQSAKDALAFTKEPGRWPASVAFTMVENKRTLLPYSFEIAAGMPERLNLQVTIPPNFRWRFQDDDPGERLDHIEEPAQGPA